MQFDTLQTTLMYYNNKIHSFTSSAIFFSSFVSVQCETCETLAASIHFGVEKIELKIISTHLRVVHDCHGEHILPLTAHTRL